MNVQCVKCGRFNAVPEPGGRVQYVCYNCHAPLPAASRPSSDTSTAVGLIGGAALGAAIAGPPGALIGAIIGAVLGNEGRGLD